MSLVGHQPQGFDDRRVWRDRMDFSRFRREQLADVAHGDLPRRSTLPRILRSPATMHPRGTAGAAWLPRTNGRGIRRSGPAPPAARRRGRGDDDHHRRPADGSPHSSFFATIQIAYTNASAAVATPRWWPPAAARSRSWDAVEREVPQPPQAELARARQPRRAHVGIAAWRKPTHPNNPFMKRWRSRNSRSAASARGESRRKSPVSAGTGSSTAARSPGRTRARWRA